MATITKGLLKIELGPVAGDGGPGTTLAALGLTKRGTAKLGEGDPTIDKIFAEEVELPIDTTTTAGDLTFSFTVADADIDTLIKVFGGTATGTSPARVWNRPATALVNEQTVKITTAKGMGIIIPRGSVVGKMESDFIRTDVFGIPITVTALQPTKTGVGPIQFIQ